MASNVSQGGAWDCATFYQFDGSCQRSTNGTKEILTSIIWGITCHSFIRQASSAWNMNRMLTQWVTRGMLLELMTPFSTILRKRSSQAWISRAVNSS